MNVSVDDQRAIRAQVLAMESVEARAKVAALAAELARDDDDPESAWWAALGFYSAPANAKRLDADHARFVRAGGGVPVPPPPKAGR